MVVESGGYVEADVVVGLVCCFLNFKLVQTGFDRTCIQVTFATPM